MFVPLCDLNENNLKHLCHAAVSAGFIAILLSLLVVLALVSLLQLQSAVLITVLSNDELTLVCFLLRM